MTVLDVLRLTRSNLLLLLAGLSIGLLAAVALTTVAPKTYTSTSTGYVNVGGSSDSVEEVISGTAAAQERAIAYVPLVTSRAVAEEIAERSDGAYPADQVAGRLTATVAPSSALMQVTATGSTPEAARDLANASLEATAAVVGELEGRDSAVRVVPLEDAQLPMSPTSPDLTKNLLVGGLIGLALAYAWAFIRKAADVKVRTIADVETAGAGGVLGTLPKDSSLAGANRATSALDTPAAEAVRQLRTNLRFVSVDSPPRAILVTSPNPAEGKSTVATTLARALARSGEHTVVIDADLRRPTVADIFGIDGSVGLTQVLSGQVSFEDAVQQVDEDGLFVLPAGRLPPDPSELLGSARMRDLVQQLEQDYMVVIDVAPLLPVTDASLLSTEVDGTVLVVKVGETRKDQLEIAHGMVERVNGRVLGVVLNQAPSRGEGSHYYGYGYGRYRRSYSAYSARAGKAQGSTKASGEAEPAETGGPRTTTVVAPVSDSAAADVPTAPVPSSVRTPDALGDEPVETAEAAQIRRGRRSK